MLGSSRAQGIMMPGRPKEDPQVVRARETEAWKLRAQGWTQQRIGDKLGIDQTTVSKLLARVADRRLKELRDKVDRQRGEQTDQLSHLLDEAMQAWELSQLDAHSGPAGDPKFLAEARALLADLRKLWGLDAPTKLEHAGPEGKPIPITFIEVGEPEEVPGDAGGVAGK
jgi:DNA-binding CsgD family transcriptional regulator